MFTFIKNITYYHDDDVTTKMILKPRNSKSFVLFSIFVVFRFLVKRVGSTAYLAPRKSVPSSPTGRSTLDSAPSVAY